jgi:PAS domain S-box-containing protein
MENRRTRLRASNGHPPPCAGGDDRFADTLQKTADGAFVTDVDGRILSWNRAAERILGFPAHGVAAKACCDVFEGYDDAGNRLCYPGCHIQALLRLSEPVASYDMRTRTKAGKAIWLNVSVLPWPASGEGAPFRLHLFRDVTATKELLTLVHERLEGGHGHPPADAPAATLTRREVEVLRLLTEGSNTTAAAARLHVSRATVRNHVQNILAKLGVHSRLAAVAYARDHRLF